MLSKEKEIALKDEIYSVILSVLHCDDMNNHSLQDESLPSPQNVEEELSHVWGALSETNINTVVGHTNLTVDNIVYNAFDQTVVFTGILVIDHSTKNSAF